MNYLTSTDLHISPNIKESKLNLAKKYFDISFHFSQKIKQTPILSLLGGKSLILMFSGFSGCGKTYINSKFREFIDTEKVKNKNKKL